MKVLILYQTFFFTTAYIFLSVSVYVLFHLQKKRWKRYKIQQNSADIVQLKREIFFSISTFSVFIVGGLCTYWLYLNGYTLIYSSASEKGFFYFIVSFFLCLVLHDFYFYFTHRMLHLPCMYEVHKVHHLSRHTTVFSALSFHPFEAFIQVAFIPLLIVGLPLHHSIIYSFITYNLLVNIIGHSGYEFFSKRFKKSFIGTFSNTPLYHHTHHLLGKINYGLYSSFWDRMMGTMSKNMINKCVESEIKMKRI